MPMSAFEIALHLQFSLQMKKSSGWARYSKANPIDEIGLMSPSDLRPGHWISNAFNAVAIGTTRRRVCSRIATKPIRS